LRADAIATISPALQQRFCTLHTSAMHSTPDLPKKTIRYVPCPWPVAQPISAEERKSARARIALGPHHRVVLYAGNLDNYQGWDQLLNAIAIASRAVPELVLLVATESEPAPLLQMAHRVGIADRLKAHRLNSEPVRRAVHAAADIAAIPRQAKGGLSVKLLDALARGVPVVAQQTATAGLPLKGAIRISRDADTDGFSQAVVALLQDPPLRQKLGENGRRYIIEQHSPKSFLEALDAVCEANNGQFHG
jgi:glycosyltransferase involved in cell wall biosynthesis